MISITKIFLLSFLSIFFCIASDRAEGEKEESRYYERLQEWEYSILRRTKELDKIEKHINNLKNGVAPLLQSTAQAYIGTINEPAELEALLSVIDQNTLLKCLPRLTILSCGSRDNIRYLSHQSIGYASLAAHNLSCAIAQNCSQLSNESVPYALSATTHLSKAICDSEVDLIRIDDEKSLQEKNKKTVSTSSFRRKSISIEMIKIKK